MILNAKTERSQIWSKTEDVPSCRLYVSAPLKMSCRQVVVAIPKIRRNRAKGHEPTRNMQSSLFHEWKGNIQSVRKAHNRHVWQASKRYEHKAKLHSLCAKLSGPIEIIRRRRRSSLQISGLLYLALHFSSVTAVEMISYSLSMKGIKPQKP